MLWVMSSTAVLNALVIVTAGESMLGPSMVPVVSCVLTSGTTSNFFDF